MLLDENLFSRQRRRRAFAHGTLPRALGVLTLTVDLIVLGSGAAAQSVAYTCREAGWSVTVVDSDPFGGTCSLRGCDPKKVLVGVSELVDWTRRMAGKGISSPPPTLVWEDMIRFKRTFVDDVPASPSPHAATPVVSAAKSDSVEPPTWKNGRQLKYRSEARSPNRSVTAAALRSMLSWVSITPLGSPVEPEVKAT